MKTLSIIKSSKSPSKEQLSYTADHLFAEFVDLVKEDCDLDELAALLLKFSQLADQLWMVGTQIRVERCPGTLVPGGFQASSPSVVADSSVRLPQGDKKLDGRPVALCVRPLVTSRSLGKEDGSQDGGAPAAVWSKARVWVSSAAEV